MRKISLTLIAVLLASCSMGEPAIDLGDDYSGIMVAVLEEQPNVAKQHAVFLEEFPDQAGFRDQWLDYRLCVTRETAGSAGDFDRAEAVGLPGGPPDFSKYTERWVSSKDRRNIPVAILPSHLRWDRKLSLCPSGVLRIGNPEIEGERAEVYVENQSTAHAWAGLMVLEKHNAVWTVVENHNWWQA